MPFGTSKHLSHRKRVAKVESAWDADEASSTAVAAAGPERPRSMSADERYTLFAHLAWLSCYPAIFAVERAADGASLTYDLSTRFASAAMRRAVSSAPDGPQARKLFERLGDAAGMLRRSANVQFVPFAQAVKAVAFLAAMVPKTIWAAERRARRVVGRAWAMTLLGVMVDLRPPPPFETHDCVRAVVVDQTYARTGGCGTGSSKYRAVEALNADGERRKEERLVYMNGLERALPAFPLSDEARERLADWGPYTQSFDRVVPVLQPSRIELVKDDLLRRSLALLAGGAPGGVGGVGGGARVGTSIEQAVRRLLARPAVDPGGATYLTWLRPLPHCDTKSYSDMIRIIEWCVSHLRAVPLVLILLGDGQTVLRMRDLKRKHPELYKHVLVCNGGFHSHAHFMFAVLRLWWSCFLCSIATRLGKERVGPDIKNLEHNAWTHCLQFILPIVVAIFVFLTEHVTEPPPELLFRDPELYISLVQNASAIVMLQFLRSAGLPVFWWHRAGRTEDSETLDDLHALAFHTFRTAHKTSSTQISLMHLLSVFATHPELRTAVRRHQFISQRGNVGGSVCSDRAMESSNEEQKERNLTAAVLDSLLFTRYLQPMMHVYRMWKAAFSDAEPGDVGFRANIVHEVGAIVEFLIERIGTTDLTQFTQANHFWHTGNPVNMRAAESMKECRPWEWVNMVAEGRSRGRMMGNPEGWWAYTLRHIRDHMFYQ